MRLLLVFLGLAAIVLAIFFIWGDWFVDVFSQHGSIQLLAKYGSWAWAFGIIVLMSDLFLPLPSTVIMSAIGYLYGTVSGGLIAAIGSFLAGSLGYWLCRLIGDHAARRILGERDYERSIKLSSSEIGIWVVMLSRWLPVFPEVISCLAGMTRMSALKFHLALFCGSLPLGFAYAYIGETGIENPMLSILLSVGIPPVVWLSIRVLFKRTLKFT
jgi:uncharacterized membrane protein YdjX (TVP38/TMEM64 family)